MANPLDLYWQVSSILSTGGLMWVLLDSLDRPTASRLAQRVGLTFPGIRVETLPGEQVLAAIAEEFFRDAGVARVIIEALNQANRPVIDAVHEMTVATIRDWMGHPPSPDAQRPGQLLWALTVDGRRTVQGEARRLQAALASEVDFLTRLGSLAAALPPAAPKKPRPVSPARAKLQAEVAALREEVASLQRDQERLLQENRNLRQQVEGWKQQHGKATARVGDLKRALETAQRAAPQPPPPPPRDETERRLREVQKENRHLAHELERLKTQAAEGTRWAEELRQRERELSAARAELEASRRTWQAKEEALQRRVETLERELNQARHDQPREQVQPPINKARDEGRIAVLADLQHLSTSARQTYGGRVDYDRLLVQVVGPRKVARAIAYLVQRPGVDYSRFIGRLQAIGFEVRLRKVSPGDSEAGWRTEFRREALALAGKIGTIVFLGGEPDVVDVAQQLRAAGVRVEVASVPEAIPAELQEVADLYHPIGLDLMERPAPPR